MTVEELFRDDKNQRNGFCLRRTKITKAEQLDRLLLILAPAYWLLAGIGMVARQRFIGLGDGAVATGKTSAACSPSAASCSIKCN